MHVARHAAGHGMHREAHLLALLLEQTGEAGDLGLGMRLSHSVARDDDHRTGGAQSIEGAPVGIGRGDRGGLGGRGGGGRGRRRFRDFGATTTPCRPLADEHVHQAPIHAGAHHIGQNGAGRTDGRPSGDEQAALDHHAHKRRRQTGSGVEERDEHRHVGAADADREHDSEDHGRSDHRDDERALDGTCTEYRPKHEPGADEKDEDEDRVVPPVHRRPLVEAVGELPRGDHAPGEGRRTDDESDVTRDGSGD